MTDAQRGCMSIRKEQIGDATLYQCDCRDILPTLPKVDAVITDPPYGIGMDGGNVGYKGHNNFEKLGWDKAPPERDLIEIVVAAGSCAILWGGNYFDLPPSRGWLLWDKGAGFKGRSYAEAEMAWTSMDTNVRIFQWDPLARGDYRGKEHPTQKPIALMEWCIGQAANKPQTILDPFMGSGTTGVACAKLGRRFVGIEREPHFFEIACRRIEQAYAQPDFFVEAPKPKAEQMSLLEAGE